jgi:oxygen-independent coproporphyrinogen-3 oxidase
MSAIPEPSEELVRRYDVPGPRYTSYPTAPTWSQDFGPEDHRRVLLEAAREATAPLSLYVHLPFCREMCAYCGCNVVVTRDLGRADRYLESLANELKLVAGLLGPRRKLGQVHWGGGTPTFLVERQLQALWDIIGGHFGVEPGAEVAVEIDPVVTSRDQLSLLRALGFNRLSMGVQDLDSRVQEAVGRIQPAERTAEMLGFARKLGFTGINFDLIYGLPHQTEATWAHTLEGILAMRPDRAAVYSFAYVPEVRPHQRRLSAEALPRGRDKLQLFRQAAEAFLAAGYRPIGMDHFALPDDDLGQAQERRTLGRNFQGYTVKAASDCVAFGVTAISDVQGAFVQNVRPLKAYSEAVDGGRLATERGIAVSTEDRRRREVITSLMCNFSVDLGQEGATHFAPELERLRDHERDGLVRLDGTVVEVTPLGRLFVRNVAMVFDAYLTGAAGAYSRTV